MDIVVVVLLDQQHQHHIIYEFSLPETYYTVNLGLGQQGGGV